MMNHRSTPHQVRPRSLSQAREKSSRVGGLLAGLGLLIVLGCGDDGIGRRYAVSGTVSYKGKPVDQGTITFEPVDTAGRVAAGTISAGSYSLTTMSPDDGALPGKYRVTIMSKDFDAAIASDPRAKNAEDPQKQAHFANKVAKNLVPAKYQLADTSTLTATVEARSNRLDFDLVD